MQSLIMRERAMIKAPDLLTGAVMSHHWMLGPTGQRIVEESGYVPAR
jgi:hypothetical protein